MELSEFTKDGLERELKELQEKLKIRANQSKPYLVNRLKQVNKMLQGAKPKK